MKRQKTLFDSPSTSGTSELTAVSVATGLVMTGANLAPAQRLFNQLLASIEKHKEELHNLRQLLDWQRSQTAQRVFPLLQRQRVLKKQIVLFFDQRLQQPQGLSKAVRAYLAQIVCDLVTELRNSKQDDELTAVYQRHAGQADASTGAAAAMQDMMADVFGLDFDDDALDSPEQVMAAAMRKMQEHSAQRASALAAKRAKRKKTPKQVQAELEAIDADKALRDLYRKLASALHPDREPDEKERQRKTALMVDVNVANEKKDLLALLQIQLTVEQINPAAVSAMADDKLRHFNRVLKEQAASLQAELAQDQQMFRMEFNLSYGPITVKSLDMVLRYEVRAQEEFIDQLKQDIEQIQSDKGLKSWVKLQKSLSDDEDDEFDPLELMSMMAARSGAR